MKRKEILARLVRGVADDMKEYHALHALLEDQFLAALRYETAKLREIGERIVALVDVVGARRKERVALVTELIGEGASMHDVFTLLAGNARETMETNWKILEELVRENKRINERNCKLLMDQHGILQRVLFGEEQTYAPA
ncbi:flagellar protein FlgN [Herbaspirillum sp. HC18]|nr:flagellar protein FlgN [Herbaspirillum sp. HC18]